MPRGGPGKKRKPGGGRKPGVAKALQREYIADKQDEAERAFAYVSDVARGHIKKPSAARVVACEIVMNRVWGKPHQSVEIMTWETRAVALLKSGTITPAQLEAEIGADLTSKLVKLAGLLPGEARQVDQVITL